MADTLPDFTGPLRREDLQELSKRIRLLEGLVGALQQPITENDNDPEPDIMEQAFPASTAPDGTWSELTISNGTLVPYGTPPADGRHCTSTGDPSQVFTLGAVNSLLVELDDLGDKVYIQISGVSLATVSNITSLSNATVFQYQVSLANQTYTADPADSHAPPIAIGRTVAVVPNEDGNNLIILNCPSVSPVTIISDSGGNTTFGPYTVQTLTGNITIDNVYNDGFEDLAGSPGTLGGTINANGTVGNGTCAVQPPKNPAIVLLWWNDAQDRWAFSYPNSAF